MADGPQVVIRNTFLEYSDDSLNEEEPRMRAFSDMTDSKLPVKVQLSSRPGLYSVQRHRLGSNPGGASPGGKGASMSAIHEEPGRSPFFSPYDVGAAMQGHFPPGAMMPPPFGAGGVAPPYPPAWWGGYGGFGDLAMDMGVVPPYPGYGEQAWGAGHNMPQQASYNDSNGFQTRNRGIKQRQREGTLPQQMAQQQQQQQAGAVRWPKPEKKEKPKAAAAPVAAGEQASTCPPGEETTVMLKNIPHAYTRDMLCGLLNEKGFEGRYDFVYLPIDFRNEINLGYGFVNACTHQDAVQLKDGLQGFAGWTVDGASDDEIKECEVSWAHPHQGLQEHVERYRNSPVMHESMPHEYKPMFFKNAVPQPFPAPTKAIKAPKLRLTQHAPGKSA